MHVHCNANSQTQRSALQSSALQRDANRNIKCELGFRWYHSIGKLSIHCLYGIYSLTQFLFHSAWQPHDIQELYRVMFDALEKQFLKDKNRQQEVQEDLINELYQGTWEDYVKCKGVSSTHLQLCYYLLSLLHSVVLLVLERIHF